MTKKSVKNDKKSVKNNREQNGDEDCCWSALFASKKSRRLCHFALHDLLEKNNRWRKKPTPALSHVKRWRYFKTYFSNGT
jgi:hypothetical protein